MKSGAQPGNKNGAKGKIWSDAIRKAVMEKADGDDGEGVKKIKLMARALVEKGLSGDIAALKEVGDRLEGKPAQVIQGPADDGAFLITLTTDDSSVL